MLSKQTLAFAASISSASAAIYQGFNYGAQTDFATEFALAKSLVGTSGAFTSARLYTSIEQNTATTPSSAFEAAIAQDVSLLLGLWASAGQATIDNEIAAIKNAIAQYGTQFTSRVVGISVGSEDLYRNSPTGIINMSGYGANPADLVNYVNQVRSAIAGTGLAGVPVGHVDTWTAWVNGSNNALISAVDFLGMDAYPYFQTTQDNTIQAGPDLFFSAYDQTVAAGQGKPVWVTETGWPASGPLAGAAQPSTENAEYYWKNVACKLLGATNTWWYTLNDAGAAPSFGVTTGSSTPLYDLACDTSSSSSSSSSAAASSTASSSAVASGTTSSAVVSASASTTAVSSSAAVSSADVSSSAVVSSSAASLSAHESTASPSNIIVPVTSSAVPSQNGGGSPGALSSKAADSSISSLASASPSVYSSILASASSAAAASPTASYTSVAPAVGSGSSSTLSSVVSSTVSTGPASGTSSVSVASYTGGASTATLGSTGGIVAAIFALLAIF